MITKRTRERARVQAVLDGVNAIADALRGGASLRQALIRSAEPTQSPFRLVAQALDEGEPLSSALHNGSTSHPEHADLASVFCVLAVHAQAGGDPLPACRALAERLARRAAAREGAPAHPTQARRGARAIRQLTPAFLLIVAMSDPRGAVQWFAEPATRLAIAVGLLLQAAGALWVRAIVHGVAPGSHVLAQVPVVRAVRAIVAGRVRSSIDTDVAECAWTVSQALDAGLSVTAAVAVVAPHVRGAFGVALRNAVAEVGVPLHEAVNDAVADLDGDAVDRFARVLASGAELGVPVAAALRALAADLDERASLRLTEDVRRASMRVLVPLGVLVLPAFVLACLVPLFVGGLQGIAG